MILGNRFLSCLTSHRTVNEFMNRELLKLSYGTSLIDLRQKSKEPASSKLSSTLQRIFDEHGLGIFERRNDPEWKEELSEIPEENELEDEKDGAPKPMTVEELHAMRMEIMPQLLYAAVNLALGIFSQHTLALL